MKKKQQTRDTLLVKIDFLQKRVDGLENMKTARFRAQEAFQESIELYRTLMEISPEAIALIDLSETIIMVNEQAVRLFGAANQNALVGKNAVEIISLADRERARANIKRTLTEPLRDIKYDLLKSNGARLSVEINSSVIRNRQGQPVAVMDTKYKSTSNPSSDDVAQVVAYAESTGCHDAVLSGALGQSIQHALLRRPGETAH